MNLSRKGIHGFNVTISAPSAGVVSNDIYTLKAGTTGWCGVVQNDAAVGAAAAVLCGAQIAIPKNTSAGESFAVGALVYKDATTKAATASSTGNDYIGRCAVAAAVADTTVMTQFAPTGG